MSLRILHTADNQSIGTFAKHHQVLFFTCHPEHAGELQEKPGRKTCR